MRREGGEEKGRAGRGGWASRPKTEQGRKKKRNSFPFYFSEFSNYFQTEF
jgi:hypothetical protein